MVFCWRMLSKLKQTDYVGGVGRSQTWEEKGAWTETQAKPNIPFLRELTLLWLVATTPTTQPDT